MIVLNWMLYKFMRSVFTAYTFSNINESNNSLLYSSSTKHIEELEKTHSNVSKHVESHILCYKDLLKEYTFLLSSTVKIPEKTLVMVTESINAKVNKLKHELLFTNMTIKYKKQHRTKEKGRRSCNCVKSKTVGCCSKKDIPLSELLNRRVVLNEIIDTLNGCLSHLNVEGFLHKYLQTLKTRISYYTKLLEKYKKYNCTLEEYKNDLQVYKKLLDSNEITDYKTLRNVLKRYNTHMLSMINNNE